MLSISPVGKQNPLWAHFSCFGADGHDNRSTGQATTWQTPQRECFSSWWLQPIPLLIPPDCFSSKCPYHCSHHAIVSADNSGFTGYYFKMEMWGELDRLAGSCFWPKCQIQTPRRGTRVPTSFSRTCARSSAPRSLIGIRQTTPQLAALLLVPWCLITFTRAPPDSFTPVTCAQCEPPLWNWIFLK